MRDPNWSENERLYNLLPAIHRIRDTELNAALRALLSVIEGELEQIEANIDGLYRDWFIETCREWAVQYIGDLLAVRPLHTVGSAGVYSLRAYVANTISYRRRKGTASVLEQLARDITGWPARAVEFFQLLAWTQHMNHIRATSHGFAELRDPNRLDLLETPFESGPRTVDVRRIGSRRGKYGIQNIGLFLWRLQAYPLQLVDATQVGSVRYRFDPLGFDIPLFNQPQTETEITHLAEEINVPAKLRRLGLWKDLEEYRQSLVEGRDPPVRSDYFSGEPVLSVCLIYADRREEVKPEELQICDLTWEDSKWVLPISTSYELPDSSSFATKVGVDPELGRLVILDGIEPPVSVEVSYSYGFSGDIGGGPYDRRDVYSMDAEASGAASQAKPWRAFVSANVPPADLGHPIYDTLISAVNAWKSESSGTVGIICMMDSHTYSGDLTGDINKIEIPRNSRLYIMAGSPPEIALPYEIEKIVEETGQLVRPHVDGDVSVVGEVEGEEPTEPGELVLDGLLIEGKLTVLIGDLGSLRVAHSTLVPGHLGLNVNSSSGDPIRQNDRLKISLEKTICGPITLADTIPELNISDSIIDSNGGDAIEANGAAATFEQATIFGRSEMQTLAASEVLFTDTVRVTRRQQGCVRFSYLPPGSQVPRRYRCQPDLALAETDDAAEELRVLQRLVPRFTSEEYGGPAYAQLSRQCPTELTTGAEDGSEMGAFCHLKQPHRTANLEVALDEYLRFGLEAGIFLVT